MSATLLLVGTAQELNLQSFSPRPPHPDNAKSCELAQSLLLGSKGMRTLRWGLMSAFELPTDPQPARVDPMYGFAIVEKDSSRPEDIKGFLAFELLSPLLRKDLTDGERIGAQVLVAITLVHETIHVLNFAKGYKEIGNLYNRKPTPREWREQYCLDEPLLEAGYSAEYAVRSSIKFYPYHVADGSFPAVQWMFRGYPRQSF